MKRTATKLSSHLHKFTVEGIKSLSHTFSAKFNDLRRKPMLIPRLFSQAAAFSAALFMAGAGLAQDVVPGGASLSVSGNVQTDLSTADLTGEPIAIITSQGSFDARNLVEDFDSFPSYLVQSNLVAGGREFFDTSFSVTPGEIDAILAGFGGGVDDVAPLLTALVTGPAGTVLIPDSSFFAPIAGLDVPGAFAVPGSDFFAAFEGLAIAYAFSVDIATAQQLSGTYAVSSLLLASQLEVLQDGLVSAFGPINFEDNFDFAFNASISPVIAPVQLPAALPMMLGGLVLLGWLGRRRRVV